MRDNLGNEYEVGVITVDHSNQTLHTLTIQPQNGYYTAGNPGTGYQRLTLNQENDPNVQSLQYRVSELETLVRMQADLINGLTDRVDKLLKIKEVSTLKLEKEMR